MPAIEDDTALHPFSTLTPERVLDALEARGLRCDGRLLTLNSYENRVYMVGLEDGPQIVAKFYRPERWSDAQILEEHAFAHELAEEEIPLVPPLRDPDGETLHHDARSPSTPALRFATFERRGGRAPELDRRATRLWLGRFIGRIHAVGASTPFVHRPALDRATFGDEPLAWIRASNIISPPLDAVWAGVVDHALAAVAACEARAGATRAIRLHGDCHVGNILWTDAGPHFVDLDDCRSGPALQDLWMLLSGSADEMTQQLADVLEGYGQFRDLDPRELHLLEALRTLRMIHYSAWIARRWSDPAFPSAFPFFGSDQYWQNQILALREQIAAMDEPALAP